MLAEARLDDLGRLFALLSRVGRVDLLRVQFSAFVKVRAGSSPLARIVLHWASR